MNKTTNNFLVKCYKFCIFKHETSNAIVMIKGSTPLAATEQLKNYVSNPTEWIFVKVTSGMKRVT